MEVSQRTTLEYMELGNQKWSEVNESEQMLGSLLSEETIQPIKAWKTC